MKFETQLIYKSKIISVRDSHHCAEHIFTVQLEVTCEYLKLKCLIHFIEINKEINGVARHTSVLLSLRP
jgi:hypothetical protein